MYLRLSRYDEHEHLRDGKALTTLPGFHGFASAENGDTGEVCMASVWETRDHMEDSLWAEDQSVADSYELSLQIGPVLEGRTGCIRLIRVAGLVEHRARAMVAGFEDNCRTIEQQPGFMGYLVASDVKVGKVTSISRWESREAMEASEAAATDARERGLETIKPLRRPIVAHYDIVVVRGAAKVAAPA